MIEISRYVDTAALDELRQALGEDLAAIIDEFLLELDSMVGVIEVAVEAGNPSATAKHAHALKGSAGNMGAVALADVSAQIERFAKAGDMESARQLCAPLSVIAATSARIIRDSGYSSQ
jgi:HPt (histidine-containing phosphotransfer) domain-containing protein